ncbi:unnamed protein product [Victoria cruziana]
MPREKDPLWEYGTEEEGKIKCSFCEKGISGGITRFKYHLAQVAQNNVEVCARASPSARDAALAAIADLQSRPRKPRKKKSRALRPQSGVSGCGSSATCTEPPLAIAAPSPTAAGAAVVASHQPRKPKAKDKERIDLLLVKFVVVNNLPFRSLRSPDFQEAILAIANYGPGYVPPTYETFRTKLLEDLKGQAAEYVEEVRRTWASTGCTLMSGAWKDARGRVHVNLLASSPKGTVFLKSQCFVGIPEDVPIVADFLRTAIDEIGPENVVQVVTVNEPDFVRAGSIIEQKYPNIFRSSCAAYCIDLMLDEVGKLPYMQSMMLNIKKIVKFLYRNQDVVGLLKAHTKGKELQRPIGSKFLTQICCLQSIIKSEEVLRKMVVLPEWQSSPHCNSDEGTLITEVLQGDEFWQTGKEIVGSVEPLVKVLRMVDGDGSTMGYVYEALHRAKEAIKSFHENNVERFMPLWEIIDACWHNELQSPLIAAAAYLNPHLFYDNIVTMNAEIRVGLEKVIQKMAPQSDSAQVAQELTRYHARDRKIFSGIGVDLLRTAHPRIWWEMCGSDIPILQSLAIKILSQPCSASACERNKSALKTSHVKKRNNLEPKALNNLVHMRMNLQLKKTSVEKRKKDIAPIFIENIEAFKDSEPISGSKRGGIPLFQDVDDESSSSEGEEEDDSSHAETHGMGYEFLIS